MRKTSKIYIAGHNGLVGSAIVRLLKKRGYKNLVLKTRAELDLMDQKKVADFFKKEKPEYVFLAAAKVGGILANNTYPASFIHENIAIENNIIHEAHISQVKKLLFLGSSCIYPKMAPQPTKEEDLLTGLLEPTNEPYAIAKIAGIIMCQSYRRQYGSNFISVMPTNLYGPNDNFNPQNSHVIAGLLNRFHEAKIGGKKEVIAWGSGNPLREFLYVDDMADACIFLMNNYDEAIAINIGTGKGTSIKKLTELVKKVVDFKGRIIWDETKPDGAPKKLLDVSKIHKLGWEHSTNIEDGLEKAYKWFIKNKTQ